ncbi:MAG: response regulator transcription factor [Planctomycetaceae bacterium]|nr:response regulator transcription factor [Planctomycetaceae bacterium]
MQTLRLLGLGLSNQEIARTIHVRLETAKEHVLNAMRKLDVADRTQAAVTAIQNGWLS